MRNRQPMGTTALSMRLIPACGSDIQRLAGIDDSAEALVGDIVAKTKGFAKRRRRLSVGDQCIHFAANLARSF